MKFHLLILGTAGISLFALWGCANSPGRPTPADIPINPSEITDFNVLYGQNCAGCHGENGKGGAAISLADPVYLAVADDAVVRRATAEGIAGTSMPAFAQSAGGMLTDKQIDELVAGIRERWSQPDVLRGANPPPYSSSAPGDLARGAEAYAKYCSSCHGAGGRGGERASSIVDGSFLALLNDQELRTIVIVGRPGLGAPDWRNNVPGQPMSAQDVSDVVAWLAAQRSKFPGQPYPNTAKSTGELR
ncbi:MAG: cytochrome c [Candidatus Acidiferrales bacterium]